uniref:Uncharacterized histidine-rich protein DDB_G0274557 n=1 Tax=Solanum tuberosum TaxID=4113 RepID=M1DJP5_SOLTU
MDSMDRIKALEELDGHKIKKYNVWKGYDGPYENGNGALVYDGDSYEGYDGLWDNEQHGGENYYSGDDFEMNGTYDSCDDVEGMEEPYGVYHCGDEGSHATHHGYDGDVRYNSFSHRSYESFEQNIDRNGGCEVEFTTSSCATSYPKNEGLMFGWAHFKVVVWTIEEVHSLLLEIC